MRLPVFGRRLSADAFTNLLVEKVIGRAPHMELRTLERLTLRVAAVTASEQRVHLDRAFEEYQRNPGELQEILDRWASLVVDWNPDQLDLAALVPLVKGRRWLEEHRAYVVEQFGTDAGFKPCWEIYNAELILVYAEIKSGIRFVRSDEIEAAGLDRSAARGLAIKNLAERTRDLRYAGGGSEVVIICAEGNLEPSLILLEHVWRDARARVDGSRLVTIAERGFAITAGSENLLHIWQLAADAADSYRKAQYPVSPHVFEQRAGIFELVDGGEDDETHAIPSITNLDVHAIKKGGGSDLLIVAASPLQADTRSVYRLFQKIDNYLHFIAGDAYRNECGVPSKARTRIVVRVHPETDASMLELLASIGEWVESRNASLEIAPLDDQVYS